MNFFIRTMIWAGLGLSMGTTVAEGQPVFLQFGETLRPAGPVPDEMGITFQTISPMRPFSIAARRSRYCGP